MKNEKISKEGKEDLEVLSQEIKKCKNILSSLGEKPSLDDDIVYGTGISWSIDSGNTWSYTEQPVDEYPEG